MYDMIEVVNEILPADKPIYLMGVGTRANMLEAIDRGVDMMDCVMPTRNGRNGMLFTMNGILNMRNLKWANDFSPLDPDGTSFVDHAYSRAYVRHLFVSQELLALQIGAIHNLCFYLHLMDEARRHIIEGDFSQWKRAIIPPTDPPLMTHFRLKILDRYIIGKFLGTYVFAIVLILAITIMFDVNEKLDSFLKAPLKATIFDYFLNFLPYFANQFSPPVHIHRSHILHPRNSPTTQRSSPSCRQA